MDVLIPNQVRFAADFERIFAKPTTAEHLDRSIYAARNSGVCALDCENKADCGKECRRLGALVGADCVKSCDPCNCKLSAENAMLAKLRKEGL